MDIDREEILVYNKSRRCQTGDITPQPNLGCGVIIDSGSTNTDRKGLP